MPLLKGWHFVDSNRKSAGVRTPSGAIVSRTEAENAGARWMGYKSEHDYRNRRHEADSYVRSVMSGRQGQRDIQRAREIARSRGERFDAREYRKTVIALRNTERNAKGDPVNRGPDSPISEFHRMTTDGRSSAWDRFITGTDTPEP